MKPAQTPTRVVILCELLTGRPALSAGGKRWPSRGARRVASRAINGHGQPHAEPYRSVTDLARNVFRFLDRYARQPRALLEPDGPLRL